MADHETDVVIVGAGPVGLFAVFECGMLKIRTHVIDALDFIGGQCAALYPEKPIYDIPGYPVIEASTLIDRLGEQASSFNPAYHLGETVTGLAQTDEARWRLTTGPDTSWKNSGDVILDIFVGTYTVRFRNVSGWERPVNQSIEVTEGSTASTTGVYTAVE